MEDFKVFGEVGLDDSQRYDIIFSPCNFIYESDEVTIGVTKDCIADL